jgi:hypothetical protein
MDLGAWNLVLPQIPFYGALNQRAFKNPAFPPGAFRFIIIPDDRFA